MRSPTPLFFVCTRIFVLQFGLLVLYKYWPMPTCIFFSLVIISLCWLHLPAPLETTLYSFFTWTEYRILIFGYTSLELLTLLLRTSQNLSCTLILSP